MKLLILSSVALLGLLIASIAGLINGQPGLLMSWLCLSPALLPLWGVSIYRAFQGRRVLALSDAEYRALQRARHGQNRATANQTGG